MAEKQTQLNSGELAAFCAQLSMILKSGITAADGLSVMAEDAVTGDGREILDAVSRHAAAGEPLAASLKAAGVFPAYMTDMVELGEASGRLEQVLDSLCSYYEREDALARSVRSAVTYPLIMVMMMLIVIAVLVLRVLPMFREVFDQLGGGAGGVSAGMLRFGGVIGVVALVLVGLIALGFLVFAVLRASPRGRAALSRLRSRFFLTRRISDKISSGRVASALALSFASGIEPDCALAMASRLISDDPGAQAKLAAAQTASANGGSFADALCSSGIFSGVYSRMAAVGFRAGSADKVMAKLAERYEEDVDVSLENLISVLEPTLVAALSVIVGMILLAVMLPLMGVMSSIG